MTQNTPEQPEGARQGAPDTTRNPYIINFCKVLVEKKGEEHDPEALKKLLDDMYKVYEYLLGTNMINSLPEDVRRDYLKLSEDLSNLSYEKIGEIFDKNVSNYEQIMKQTMKQFAEIFMRNRNFNAEDYKSVDGSQPE